MKLSGVQILFIVIIVLVVVGVVATIIALLVATKKAKKRDSEASEALRTRLSVENTQIQQRESAAAARQAEELRKLAAARASAASAANNAYALSAAAAERDELNKRQEMYNETMQALTNARSTSADASKTVEELLNQISNLRKCPQAVCNATSETWPTKYLIEQWDSNTATTFIGSVGRITKSANGTYFGVETSPVALDFNASRLRSAAQCDGPLSAAGTSRPFVYTVQKTLFGGLTITMRLGILVQLFDVSRAKNDNITIGVTASAWTRSPDGSFVKRPNFYSFGSVDPTIGEIKQGEEIATTTACELTTFSAPYAASYLSMPTLRIVMQNRTDGAIDDEVLCSPGDIIRLDFTGISACVFVYGETAIGRGEFRLGAGDAADGVGLGEESACAASLRAMNAATSGNG